MADFETAVSVTLENEGGYVNHSADRGGPTCFGITMETLSNWRKAPVSDLDVRNLTVDEAKRIYHDLYWAPLLLEGCPDPHVAALLFDQAVNAGVKTVALRAQRVINTLRLTARRPRIAEDGRWGTISSEALNEVEPREFIVEFFKATQLFYVDLVRRSPDQLVFLKGWISRTHEMIEGAFASMMVADNDASSPSSSHPDRRVA